MKTKLITIILLVFLGTSSCKKEPVTIFPDYDRNWLIVNDNPNDAVVHATYLFYQNTGIPVYFNDTIGTQQRVDVFGHAYTYYAKLSLTYSLGGVQAGATPYVTDFSLCAKSDVPVALDYLKNNIFSEIPKGIYVPSILLVESLNTNAFGSYAYKGLNTIAIGQVSKIPTMDDTTKQKYKGAILRAILTNAVLDDKYSDLLNKFYNESRKYSSTKDLYGLNTYYLNSSYVTGLPDDQINIKGVGFLDTDPRSSYSTPLSTWMDACMYIEAICGSTTTQFQSLYGSYPVIMTKYGYIKQILHGIGYQIQ